jgi:L-malate glycosyltransferase
MIIYFIENENPSVNSSGGIMSYLVNLSKFLMNENIETTLIGSGTLKKDSTLLFFNNFISVSNREDVSNIKYLFNLCKKSFFYKFKKNSIIHVQRPDMVVPLIISAFRKRCSLVCSLHGAHDIAVFDKKGWLHGVFYSFLQLIAFLAVDKLIAVDEGTKRYYLHKYPWIKKKISVVPIAVDLEKFVILNKAKIRRKYKLPITDKIMIFVGRLEKEKNISFIINSFELVKEQEPSAKLLLIGNGRDISILKKYAHEKKINSIVFWGEVNNAEIPELLNCADVFVFASLYEGSPNVIKEALACGLPVVSVNVGDVAQVIENIENCYLAERDVSDFSGKVIKVFNNKTQNNIREKVMRFSNENVCQKTLEIYKSVISEK